MDPLCPKCGKIRRLCLCRPKPGLYRAEMNHAVAGFVIEADGSLGNCAPIIRRQFDRWSRQAVRIGD